MTLLAAIATEMEKVGSGLSAIDRGYEEEGRALIREAEARVLALLDTATPSLLDEHPELARWHAQRRVDAVLAWQRWV